MPNNIVNILHIDADENNVKKVLDFLSAEKNANTEDNELISFNSIVKMPEELEDDGWYDWRLNHWGTKWDAYNIERLDDKTLSFMTAWSGVPDLMAKLSKKFPDIRFDYAFADEDASYNTGKGFFINGEKYMIYPKGNSKEAYEIYFLTRPEERDYYRLTDDGNYEYIEIED